MAELIWEGCETEMDLRRGRDAVFAILAMVDIHGGFYHTARSVLFIWRPYFLCMGGHDGVSVSFVWHGRYKVLVC